MYMFSIIAFILFIAIGGYLVFLKPSEKNTKKIQADSPIKSKRLLTEHEKKMYRELTMIPNCHIFVQVCLGAILWTSTWQTRNKFNKKIADFVVTDLDFNIRAVIELDDKSHDNKIEADQARDAMIREAGYKVLRYRNIPNVSKLMDDILG